MKNKCWRSGMMEIVFVPRAVHLICPMAHQVEIQKSKRNTFYLNNAYHFPHDAQRYEYHDCSLTFCYPYHTESSLLKSR